MSFMKYAERKVSQCIFALTHLYKLPYKAENWHALSHEQCFSKHRFLDICRCVFKVNKSVHIAKSRQRYHKTFNNILLRVSNRTLKDVYMLNYGTIENTNSLHYTRFFFIIIFLSYYISLKQTHLVFCTFF